MGDFTLPYSHNRVQVGQEHTQINCQYYGLCRHVLVSCSMYFGLPDPLPLGQDRLLEKVSKGPDFPGRGGGDGSS